MSFREKQCTVVKDQDVNKDRRDQDVQEDQRNLFSISFDSSSYSQQIKFINKPLNQFNSIMTVRKNLNFVDIL